ncbi:hypothetical protein HU200_066123 [Digitaria exilis]|uniref:Uncharacterized protein n=1 Tax=Digitaria exilis TaxID=1010633 RepID=A0A835DU39_9POAL|nr:hypothetical protein HU200_066123 [Digitaria exilis]
MVMWAIWMHRNSIIFDGGSCWQRSFVEGMKAVTLRVKPHIRDMITV